MRAHGLKNGSQEIESDVLMCCETTSTRQKKGLFGGTETIISAVYLPPKWLVWANSTNGNTANAGSAQLRNIEARDYETTAMFAIMPNRGLNITGRYTDVNQTGITFVSLGSKPDGKKFRDVLKDAMNKKEGNDQHCNRVLMMSNLAKFRQCVMKS